MSFEYTIINMFNFFVKILFINFEKKKIEFNEFVVEKTKSRL